MPIPKLPDAAKNKLLVAVMVFVALKYGNWPVVPVYGEPDMSEKASWPTVNAPPTEVCLTTWEVPPVAEKSVVPIGKVKVFVPEV